MKWIYLLLAFFCTYLPARGQVRLKFELQALPATKEAKPEVFIAGNFNNWNPHDTTYRFSKMPDGTYLLEKQLPPANYEYKITRGSWAMAEAAGGGAPTDNRFLQLNKDTTVKIDVINWADNFVQIVRHHSFSKQVKIVDTAFFMPQLNAKRRIWIYLPSGYGHSHKSYPVLYMQDGQNLFDEFSSAYGEWAVDECLDSLIAKGGKEWIVVGVDHGGAERLKEYNPYDSEYGEGKGKAYVNFLVHHLKPYIDQHYRTLRNKENTAIAGSSMGGLISMYAIATFPDVFGKAGIFSPAFWLGKEIETTVKNAVTRLKDHQIYFVAGALESKSMLSDMELVYQLLDPLQTHKNFKLVEKADGQHNEKFWHREFEGFYQFISN